MASNRTALFSRRFPGGVWTVQDMKAHPGMIFFVDSSVTGASDSAGFGLSPDKPFATLDYAVGQCTASAGDTIFCMPNHSETLVADSGVDIDVVGVHVIGLGEGSVRPTFSFGTAVTADFKLAANGVTVENLLFLGRIDALTGPIEISGTDCKLLNCEYRDVTGQATDIVMAIDGCDRLLIDGFRVIGAAAAGGNSAIAIDGCDYGEIRNFHLYGNFAVGAIDLRTTPSVALWIHDGLIWTENAADIAIVDTITTSTGIIGPNLYLNLQDDAANVTEAVTGATFNLFPPVYVCNAANQQALQINWTAVADA